MAETCEASISSRSAASRVFFLAAVHVNESYLRTHLFQLKLTISCSSVGVPCPEDISRVSWKLLKVFNSINVKYNEQGSGIDKSLVLYAQTRPHVALMDLQGL